MRSLGVLLWQENDLDHLEQLLEQIANDFPESDHRDSAIDYLKWAIAYLKKAPRE